MFCRLKTDLLIKFCFFFCHESREIRGMKCRYVVFETKYNSSNCFSYKTYHSSHRNDYIYIHRTFRQHIGRPSRLWVITSALRSLYLHAHIDKTHGGSVESRKNRFDVHDIRASRTALGIYARHSRAVLC